MKKPHDHRPARFAVLVVASNLLAACCTTIVIILAFSLYQRHYTNPEQQSSVRATRKNVASVLIPYYRQLNFIVQQSKGRLTSSQHGIVQISNSDPNRLCTVTEITPEGFLKPVWRSYNGSGMGRHRREIIRAQVPPDCFGGGFAMLPFPVCYETVLAIRLTSFNMPSYSTKDEIARFLEQTTFGQTLADIATFDTSNLQLAFANWIKTQQTTVPLTSHRAYYRRRMNARYEFASVVGASRPIHVKRGLATEDSSLPPRTTARS
jgi:hypothetical protein